MAGRNLEVYDVTVGDGSALPDVSHGLHGRRVILTSAKEITRANLLAELVKALAVHHRNREEILYLKKFNAGIQPILNRHKEYNAEINNKVVVNIANEIITFKEAEFAGEPIQYVSRRGNKPVEDANKEIPDKVSQVNDMMISEGKQTWDLQLAHEMFICGQAYRLTYHDDGEERLDDYLDEAPFEIAVPDTENTFVVRCNDPKKRVVMGVTYVYKDPPAGGIEYTVYTPNVTYTVEGLPYAADAGRYGLTITDEVKHNFGMISLIEYPCNPDRIGAFEVVHDLLAAVSTTLSNQMDGLEQFIQALMVFDGVDISREDFLELKDLGAIKLPATQNTGGNGRKLYYLNEQLDQTQTNSLVSSMKQIILEIVGMPSQGNASTGDSSNNGAVIMKNGWWHAESRSLQTQTMWKKAETDFLKVVLKICHDTNTLTGLKISDLEPRFWRQSYEDLLVKTQSFSTLRTAGMPAIQAFKFSHLSKDPESDAIVYDDYQKMLADELDRLNGVGDDIPLREDDTVDPTEPNAIEAAADGTGNAEAGKKGDWAICPVCGKRFQKKEPGQKYSSIACANKARRSTPRYGGVTP
jgi:SPP1 family phage portal protein